MPTPPKPGPDGGVGLVSGTNVADLLGIICKTNSSQEMTLKVVNVADDVLCYQVRRQIVTARLAVQVRCPTTHTVVASVTQ